MSSEVENKIKEIGAQLYQSSNPMFVIASSGLTATEISAGLLEQRYPPLFSILSTRDVDTSAEVINALLNYGFKISQQAFSTALATKRIGIAHKYIQAGFVPTPIIQDSVTYDPDIHYLPWIRPKDFKTPSCNINAIAAALDAMLATGVDINYRGLGVDNVFSAAMCNICGYTLNDDPEECLMYLELYLDRGANYLITGAAEGEVGSCLKRVVPTEFGKANYPLLFKILDLLEARHGIVPISGDSENPAIAAYMNHKLSAVASAQLASEQQSSITRRRM